MNSRWTWIVLACLVSLIVLTCAVAWVEQSPRNPRGLFPIEQDGRWGVINQDGEVLVQPTYVDVPQTYLHMHAPKHVGGETVLLIAADGMEWLHVERSGSMKIPAPVRYKKNEYIVVNMGDGMYGVFSATDIFNPPALPSHVVDPRQQWKPPEEVRPHGAFSEGLIPVSRAGKFGFANRQGTLVTELKYDEVDIWPGFSGGLAAASQGEKWGYIDRQGTWVIEPQFKRASAFDGELARVWRFDEDSPGAIIDRSGAVVRNWPTTSDVYVGSKFSEGLSAVKDESSKLYGFMDLEAAWHLPPKYKFVECFNEGLAPVEFPDGSTPGYINHDGELVVPVPGGYNLQWFVRGLAWVETSARKGYINPAGEWVWSTRN